MIHNGKICVKIYIISIRFWKIIQLFNRNNIRNLNETGQVLIKSGLNYEVGPDIELEESHIINELKYKYSDFEDLKETCFNFECSSSDNQVLRSKSKFIWKYVNQKYCKVGELEPGQRWITIYDEYCRY